MKIKRDFALLLVAALVVSVALTVSGCGSKKEEGPVIRVGSKDFTEGLLVGEIYALALENAGYTVERKLNIAGSLVHTAITSGDIDLYPEYTGTALLSVLQLEMNSDPDAVYSTVKEEYDRQFDLTWLNSTAVNNTNGFAIRRDVAEEYGIYTISDLQANADKIRVCSQGEFEYREDGLPGLEKVYGEFDFASISVYDSGIKYQVLLNGEADLCFGYSTDAQLADTENFVYLEDDLYFFPPYYMAPVIRNELLKAYPEIADVLNAISAKLDNETMIALNAKVDIDKREVDEVAKEFFDSIKQR